MTTLLESISIMLVNFSDFVYSYLLKIDINITCNQWSISQASPPNSLVSLLITVTKTKNLGIVVNMKYDNSFYKVFPVKFYCNYDN